MRRRDPLLALVLGTLASKRGRAATEDAVRPHPVRISIPHHQNGMRGASPRDPPPVRFRAAISAAIYDDPLALMAQFEGQCSGMRMVIKTARRRLPGVDQHESLESLQPIEAGVGRMQ